MGKVETRCILNGKNNVRAYDTYKIRQSRGEAMRGHREVKTTVRVYDTIYDRAEYWRKKEGVAIADNNNDCNSRSAFYCEAVFMHCNNLAKWYPQFAEGEVEAINNNARIKRLRKVKVDNEPITTIKQDKA